MHVTHVGGPTVLLEVSGWRILTDPTFDPPGRRYGFGWGTSSRKTVGPALSLDEAEDVDVVLLSHDHHADNLDDAGRTLLGRVCTVLTTMPGARRLKHRHARGARGMRPGDTIRLRPEPRAGAPARPDLLITATPARHGPLLSRLVVGAVIGFRIETLASGAPTIWITGDSVMYRRLRKAAEESEVDILVLHLGNVGFSTTGPVRYSMTAANGVDLTQRVDPQVVIPVHFEGWSHFRESRSSAAHAFRSLPAGLRDRVMWLEPGRRTDLRVTRRGHRAHGPPASPPAPGRSGRPTTPES